MAQLTESVTRMIDQFAKLPGVGRKSAERMAYYVLRVPKEEALELADSIRDVKQNVRYCKTCFHLAEEEECEICRDPRRDQSQLCVLEQPRDLSLPRRLRARQVISNSIFQSTQAVDRGALST